MKTKEIRGITLISLVVMIIVLLILAGVSLSMLTGENGIIKNAMKAAIPNGFFYVTGKPSDGLVISDRYGDDDNNSIGGNQFVWIPCSEDINATLSENNGTEVTYEKINGLATTRNRNYGDKQYYYKTVDLGSNAGKDIVDWKDKSGILDSVKKYKGFYIARYEAGLPTDENVWAWKNNAIYG